MSIFFTRSLGVIPLDVVVKETHESELTITKNPIEFGADVADHAYVMPKKLTIEAVTASQLGYQPGLIMAAYMSLVALQEQREPFTIITGLSIYRNMLIERIEVERDSSKSRVLWFTADCSEVIIVDTESTSASSDSNSQNSGRGARQTGTSNKRLADGVKDKGSPTVQRGHQVTRTVTGAEAGKISSIIGIA